MHERLQAPREAVGVALGSSPAVRLLLVYGEQ
jgi:hypothetical protein